MENAAESGRRIQIEIGILLHYHHLQQGRQANEKGNKGSNHYHTEKQLRK